MRHAPIGLGILVLVGCGGASVPQRVPFTPPTEAPTCSASEGTHIADPIWNEFNAAVGKFAADLGTNEREMPLVFEHLRLSVRSLANTEGCTVKYGDSNNLVTYEITCGNLSPDVEAMRARTERAVRNHYPKLLAVSAPIEKECTFSPVFQFSYHMGEAARGELKGAEEKAARATSKSTSAGCDTEAPEVCREGCKKGNADACKTLAMALRDKDPEGEAAARYDACVISIEKPGNNDFSDCYQPLDAIEKRGAAGELNALIDRICTKSPTSQVCVTSALNHLKKQTFDLKRAKKVLAAIDACQDSACPKGALLYSRTPYYDPAMAKKAMVWVADQCSKHAQGCGETLGVFLDPAAPHFDRKLATQIAGELEKGCDGSVKFEGGPKTSQYVLCAQAFAAYSKGGLPDPNHRAREIAERMCTSEGMHSCTQIARCHLTGTCGLPVDVAAARESMRPECAWFQKAAPASRSQYAACRYADGLEPFPKNWTEK